VADGLQLPVGQVPHDWKVLPLKDVTSKIGSGSTPRGGASVYVEAGTSFIRSQNVLDHGFSFDGLVRINDEAAYSLRGVEVLEGDVLINITGDSILRTCIVPNEVLPARVSQHVAILRSNGQIEPQVLQKWLSLELMKDFMLGHSSGGTRKAVTKGDLERFPVPVPPLAEQRAISGVLGALDDKIKSNRQKAELIDAILLFEYQLLLKRDDAKTVPLGTLVKPALGGVWGSDNATEKEQLKVSCFRGVDLASIARTEWPKPPTRWIREGLFAPRKFGSGEIWLEGSGSFCGRSLLISESIQQLFDEPVCYSNFVKRVVPISDPRLSVVSWLALRHAYNIGEVAQSRIGSAFPNLDLGALLSNTQVLLPNDSDLNKLCQLAESRLDTQVLRENRTLSELRDTLLPELLSGRLRVKEAESMMENV
jgi:type I restriction enzyme S subunit